jgi:hypothetical protein
VRYLVLFVIDLKTRRVHIAGLTAQADGTWMAQIARNLTDAPHQARSTSPTYARDGELRALRWDATPSVIRSMFCSFRWNIVHLDRTPNGGRGRKPGLVRVAGSEPSATPKTQEGR